MEVADFDLDRTVLRAWSSFRRRLADVLEGLGDHDVLYVEAPTSATTDNEGSPPFCEAVATDDVVHAELSGNSVLARQFHLDAAMTAQLTRVGWQPPDESDPRPSFVVDGRRAESDRLAAMVATAFRDVWAVPHPTFLEAGPFNDALGITRDPPVGTKTLVPLTSPDRDDLQRQVEQTLADYLGHVPHKDGDGDIPIRCGSALVFIRVLDDHPLIELKSPLVVDISGRTRAAEVVADLNANWRQVKFVLIRDVVVMLLEVSAAPFVPQHLVEALRLMPTLADDLDDELAQRLEGRLPFAEHGPTSEPAVRADGDTVATLPAELASLLHLGGPGSTLTDTEAAQICGGDRDSILKLLRIASQQEGLWRRSAEEARLARSASDAADRDRQAELWQDAVERLRGALREVVTRPPA